MHITDWKSKEVRKLEDELGIDAVWRPGISGGVSLQVRQSPPPETLQLIATGKSVETAAEDWKRHTGALIQAVSQAQAKWLAAKPLG